MGVNKFFKGKSEENHFKRETMNLKTAIDVEYLKSGVQMYRPYEFDESWTLDEKKAFLFCLRLMDILRSDETPHKNYIASLTRNVSYRDIAVSVMCNWIESFKIDPSRASSIFNIMEKTNKEFDKRESATDTVKVPSILSDW